MITISSYSVFQKNKIEIMKYLLHFRLALQYEIEISFKNTNFEVELSERALG